MCGFAGILYSHPAQAGPATRGILERMGEQIAHRGPDDSQLLIEGQVGLVFRRLSIVDVQGGAQPMVNEDHSLVLVVNGEIYNHRQLRGLLKAPHQFRSSSDSEVILHLYEEMGVQFLQHLNGMFALALWDKNRQQLIIARDRLGIKPLYFHASAERLIFGSELKALLPYPDCPREVDWHAALTHSHGQPHRHNELPTFFKGLENLKGGTYLQVDLRRNATTRHTYWTLPQPGLAEYQADSRSIKQLIGGYRDLLAESVELQLMSDVGIGLFLSGGIDSVSIAGFASRFAKIPTFTVLSQSTFQNGDVAAAARAARHFGLDNHQVLFQWHDDSYDHAYWKRLLWYLETPLCSAEQLYKYELHRYARQQFPDLKCMLLGQGSDEFNGGYCNVYTGGSAHDGNRWELFMSRLEGMEAQQLLQGRNAALATYGPLLSKAYLAERLAYQPQERPWAYHADMYLRNLQVYNLWHEDRTASAHGIESRVPFLDHRLVEYTMRVPPAHHKELFWNKEILRRGLAADMPADLVCRPKVPFFYGDDVRYTYRMLYNMMVKDGRALIYEALGEPDAKHDVLDRGAVETFCNAIGEDVEFAGVPSLLTLVNLGLLQQMATETGFARPAAGKALVAERLVIDDFEQQKEALALRLGVRRTTLSAASVLKLADQVRLLTDQDGVVYIAVAGTLEYSLEEPRLQDWVRVLRGFDGRRTLQVILGQLGLHEAAIRTSLEEALDYGLLEVCASEEAELVAAPEY